MNARSSIEAARKADQFLDSEKYGSDYYERPWLFFLRFWGGNGSTTWLDVGCGTGQAFTLLPITHAIEPAPERFKIARKRKPDVKVWNTTVERMQFRGICMFKTVSYLRGFFQCNAEHEALVSINRALTTAGGRLLVDVPTERCPAPIIGRHYVEAGFIKLLYQFGFKLRARGPISREGLRLFAFDKVCEFGPECFLHPQLVDRGVGDNWRVLNAASWFYWSRFYGWHTRKRIKITKMEGGLPVTVRCRRVPWELR